MNSAIVRKYMKASSVSFLAKVMSVSSGLGVVYILTQTLGKAEFGAFMWALSFVLLISMVVNSFFQSLIMYHGAREAFDKDITRFALFWVPIVGVFIAGGMTVLSRSHWLASLAWVAPCYMLNFIMTTHYRSRQAVTTMLVFQEILPAFFKILFLGGIWLFALPQHWIGFGVALSYGLPFIVLMLHTRMIPRSGLSQMTLWDFRYGAMACVNQLMNKSTRNLLTVFLGFLASSTVVADVAIAMKLAQFLLLPKLMLAQLHVPRIGKRLADNDRDGLMNEFNHVRSVSFFLTLIGSLGFVVLGPFMLGIFGHYQSAHPLLLLLCGASIIRAGFGDIGGFLSMTGRAGTALIINAISLAVMVIALFMFLPMAETLGTGMALLLTALVGMSSIAFALYRFEGFKTMDVFIFSLMTISTLSVTILAIVEGLH